MASYSELCAEAHRLFVTANQDGVKTFDDLLSFWTKMVDIGNKFAMDSSIRGLRFDRTDFTSDTWKLVAKLMGPYELIGCAEKRMEGRKVAAYVINPDAFSADELSGLADRRKKARRKEAPIPEVITVEPTVRLVPTKPLRHHVDPSVAVIVDLANLTKHVDQNTGRMILDPKRIDWNRFRTQLTMGEHGPEKIDRLIICVSEYYYTNNYAALSMAQRAGFEIVKMYGDKEADPVVMSEITRAVLDHLNLRYNDRIPTLVLASGDKDFTSIVQTLKPFVSHEGLSLSLRVVTWKDGLSRELYCACSEVLYLDDILAQVDPFGAQLREGYRLRRVQK